MHLFYRITEHWSWKAPLEFTWAKSLCRAVQLSALGPFSPTAESRLLSVPFSCTLILLSTFTLPPSSVVSTNSSAAAYWTEWWMYPSSNYTYIWWYVSNFKPYRVSDVAHGSCTSAYADKIRESPGPERKVKTGWAKSFCSMPNAAIQDAHARVMIWGFLILCKC